MINRLLFLVLGLSPLSCVEKKQVETGIVEEEIIEDTSPITWEEEDCSYNIGDHICDLKMITAYNTVNELYNYHGEPIVLEMTSMRCSDCQRSSAANDYMTTMGSNIRWITIIMENEAGMNPNVSDAKRWANAFSLSYFYVWLGGRSYIDIHNGKTGFPYSSYPYYVLIDDDLRIYTVVEGFDRDEIVNKIADLKSSL